MVEMLQMRELLELAVDQSVAHDGENIDDELAPIQSDMLIQMLMMDRIVRNNPSNNMATEKNCPFCGSYRAKRDCECDYYIRYCFMIPDHAK